MTNSPEYRAWADMKARCYRESDKDFYRYGGRGISVCPDWLNSFLFFFEDMGGRPEGCSLDRRDNDGNYEPSNCRWADSSIQMLNRRQLPSVLGVKHITQVGGRFQVQINRGGLPRYKGSYPSLEEAVEARDSILKEEYDE